MLEASSPILLVASPAVRRAPVWAKLGQGSVQSCGHKEFSAHRHLSSERSLLIYHIGGRVMDTLRFLDHVATVQSDLCIILLGKQIGSDPVARFLRQGAFDYVTWPCSAERLLESIDGGLANRRVFLEVRNLSHELARTNRALTHDREVLQQCNRNLSVLHQLTQALAASLDSDTIAKALFAGLPTLVDTDLIGMARTNPDQVWIWSRSRERGREERVRGHLLSRLGSPTKEAARPQAHLRLIHPRHLHLVTPQAHDQWQDENAAPNSHEISLGIGPQGRGLLHVERKGSGSFTARERQLLATLGASLSLSLHNAETHQHLQDLALRDPLTDVLNRRAFDGPLIRELKAGLRYGTPACLLLVDLDYFKTVNDLLGHVAGDEVLKRVAALIRETVRNVDSVGRYGGEEFAVVLPHTDLDQAQALAERLRAIIERYAFELEDGQVRMTASIGLASLHDSAIATVGDWIAAADSALYEAKSRGRNRVVTHIPCNLAPAQASALCVAA
jgi:diguanylate cyclase (GGDEF)-like protein